jgi:hypothetical protein
MSNSTQAEDGKRHYRTMTVAHIREPQGADYVEVLFLDSARFYRLSKKSAGYADALRRLRDAMANGNVLKIGVASLDSDLIEAVQDQ